VEQGRAPEQVLAAKSDHGKVKMTRPLFEYPGTAIYDGKGDPDSASSFVRKPGSDGGN
jgi:hypothetical protein